MTELWIAAAVTDRCQLSCRHCLRDPGLKPQDLDVEVFASVLDQARAAYHAEHVGLTGGEPTLHPRFADLVAAIIDRGYRWHMVTNGQHFASRVLPLLDRNPWWTDSISTLNFSLDGAEEEINDRIRGAGAFRRVMQAITHCQDRHLPFVLQCTLNRYNADQVEPFSVLAAELGAERISFGMTMATGTILDAELGLPAAEWRRLRDQILRLGRLLQVPILMTEPLCEEKPWHHCDVFRGESLYVDERGHLMLCCQLAGVAGEPDPRVDLGDLAEVPLVEAHARLLEVVQEYERERLAELREHAGEGWGLFLCNRCLRRFGKPYWTDEGSAGGRARRARWRGAWDPQRRFGRSS